MRPLAHVAAGLCVLATLAAPTASATLCREVSTYQLVLTHTSACESATGVQLQPPLSAQQIARVCASAACSSLASAVRTRSLPSCSMSADGESLQAAYDAIFACPGTVSLANAAVDPETPTPTLLTETLSPTTVSPEPLSTTPTTLSPTPTPTSTPPPTATPSPAPRPSPTQRPPPLPVVTLSPPSPSPAQTAAPQWTAAPQSTWTPVWVSSPEPPTNLPTAAPGGSNGSGGGASTPTEQPATAAPTASEPTPTNNTNATANNHSSSSSGSLDPTAGQNDVSTGSKHDPNITIGIAVGVVVFVVIVGTLVVCSRRRRKYEPSADKDDAASPSAIALGLRESGATRTSSAATPAAAATNDKPVTSATPLAGRAEDLVTPAVGRRSGSDGIRPDAPSHTL